MSRFFLQNTEAEGTTCSSGENKHESPSHDDSMFISSTEAEFDDGTSGVTSTNESEITQNDETVSSLQQKIAELMAEKEEIKEMVETYKAQVTIQSYTLMLSKLPCFSYIHRLRCTVVTLR